MKRRRKTKWSYNAGERGRNWVRAYCKGVRTPLQSLRAPGVRDPEFRKLSAAIQEEIAGTNYTTLRRIYDEVTAEDIREAWAEARQVAK